MELPTRRTAAAMPWFLLLCLATSHVLQTLGQSTSDFISIDCGLPGETGYVEFGTLLSHTTDAGFIDANAGSNHNVDPEYINSVVPNKWWYNLRSFPGASGSRNCYTLGSLAAGLKYLIRTKFFYGNYDGLNMTPAFDVYIGVDLWTTVHVAMYGKMITEAIVVVPHNSVQVCLVNTGRGVPFISGLDLRPLNNKLYPQVTATQGLVVIHRINFGATVGSIIRYPADPYDRYWYADFQGWTPTPVISTGMKVRTDEDQFQPPQAVIQTAITTQNVSDNIEFRLYATYSYRSLGYMDTLYFSELQQFTNSNAVREYNIYRNDVQIMKAYTPPYLVGDYVTSNVSFQSSQYVVSLNATASSTRPPIINAIELFAVIPTTTLVTNSLDASAITAIKEMYKVHKNWIGDPCLPKTLAWDGLKCSDYKPPIITSVDVSFSSLSGAISPNFADLKNVKYLDLSHNNLTGSIPDTLSRLPSLVFLDLSSNKLNGSIPSGLLEKFQLGSLDLRYGDNPDLSAQKTNPDLCSVNSCKLDKGNRKGGKNKLAIYIVVPVVVIVTLVVVAILCFWLQRRRKQGSIKNSVDPTNDSDGNISLELENLQFGDGNISLEVENLQFGDGNISLELENRQLSDGNISFELENRQFTYMELEKVTNNFERQLGRGGFGCVFHGSLDNGTEVAVKLSSHSSNQDVRQFLAEAQVLARIHHKNLVYMIGFCTDREHMALVYEYMPQGTLQEHIAGEGGNGRGLLWRQRLRIALESAQGLEYLHKGCSPPIIHRDVKTANILLNAKLEVKIADFGLSKAYKCEDDTHLTTNIFAGTHGYVDPEYMRTMQPSTKSDVYSYGVVLLELVTGKPAILRNPEPITIIEWARRRLAQGDIEGVVDARMQGDHDINAVWKTTEIALKCTKLSPLDRPSMTDIVMQLQECLDLEDSSMGGAHGYYTDSSTGGMNPNMGYNTTSQNSAALR